MAEFTPAEDAFINASVDVLRAGEAVHEAAEQMRAAQEVAKPLGAALDLDFERDGVTRVKELLDEAARRGGFPEDALVVQSLKGAYAVIEAGLQLVAAFREKFGDELAELAIDRLNAKANPVI